MRVLLIVGRDHVPRAMHVGILVIQNHRILTIIVVLKPLCKKDTVIKMANKE